MKLYTSDAVNGLLKRYIENNWEIVSKEGSLLTEYVCFWEGLKSAVILEQYLNERSSAYTIKMFRNLPKKYEKYFNL